jgi:hypothetical protein
MRKEKSKLSTRSKMLWIGLLVIVVAALCVITATIHRSDSASDKEIRTAFIQKYSSCLTGNYDFTNGARISVNPTDANGHTTPIISQQVTILSTLNYFSKPSVLRFDYSMVNQDTLFNDHFVPQFAAANQETSDFLQRNCPRIN